MDTLRAVLGMQPTRPPQPQPTPDHVKQALDRRDAEVKRRLADMLDGDADLHRRTK